MSNYFLRSTNSSRHLLIDDQYLDATDNDKCALKMWDETIFNNGSNGKIDLLQHLCDRFLYGTMFQLNETI